MGWVRRNRGLFVGATLVVLAWIAMKLPSTPLPRFGIIAPIAYFVAVISDLATATILLATNRSSRLSHSTVALALAFLSSALLLFGAILVLPLLPTVPPVLSAPPQSGVWLFMFWHTAVATGALTYVAFRRRDRVASRRFVTIAAALAAGLVVAGYVVAFFFSDRLPALAGGTSLNALVTTGVGPFVAILLGIASLLAFRIREPTPIDRAYAYSNLLFFIELSVLLIDAHRYSIVYYGGRGLVLIGAALVLVAAERTLLASRSRMQEIEWTLNRVEGESAKRAGRVRAVWEIASYLETSEHDDFGAILDIAAAALRPGKTFVGLLSHLEGSQLLIDATSATALETSTPAGVRGLHAGVSFAAEDTMGHLLFGAEHARGWDDFGAVERASTVAGDYGFRSFIGAPIAMDRGSYFVTFTSATPTSDEPFAEDDLAYIEVVASFLASRFRQQRQIEQIRYQVEHDDLTGLPNRARFRAAVREAIRSGSTFFIAFLDLDGFRRINERDGHDAGDELLVAVANALGSVAGADTVARMGADEFAILVRRSATIETLGANLRRYTDVLRESLATGAAVGAARFPDDGTLIEDLMRRAAIALELARVGEPSRTLAFDPTMESIAEEARRRVAELADAIAGDQLALVYQPTFDLATRAVVGAEALVRWDHPVRGRLAPAEFIDIAERNGLIEPLSRWVCRRLARDVSGCPALPPDFRLYFNVSAHLLDNIAFISDVKAVLQTDPRLPQHLGIEVTETAAMQNVERSMNTLELFRRWGLTVAIDDFGTGYSSLAYLKRLTVDVIKLDRSFVTGLPDDESDCAIAEMLLHVTKRFRYAALAEGIETEAQLAWLLEHGCRYGQGFLIARPGPFETLLERLGVPRVA